VGSLSVFFYLFALSYSCSLDKKKTFEIDYFYYCFLFPLFLGMHFLHTFGPGSEEMVKVVPLKRRKRMSTDASVFQHRVELVCRNVRVRTHVRRMRRGARRSNLLLDRLPVAVAVWTYPELGPDFTRAHVAVRRRNLGPALWAARSNLEASLAKIRVHEFYLFVARGASYGLWRCRHRRIFPTILHNNNLYHTYAHIISFF